MPQYQTTHAAPGRDEGASSSWTIFVGAIVALAFLKEAFRGLGGNPLAAATRSVSRPETQAWWADDPGSVEGGVLGGMKHRAEA